MCRVSVCVCTPRTLTTHSQQPARTPHCHLASPRVTSDTRAPSRHSWRVVPGGPLCRPCPAPLPSRSLPLALAAAGGEPSSCGWASARGERDPACQRDRLSVARPRALTVAGTHPPAVTHVTERSPSTPELARAPRRGCVWRGHTGQQVGEKQRPTGSILTDPSSPKPRG